MRPRGDGLRERFRHIDDGVRYALLGTDSRGGGGCLRTWTGDRERARRERETSEEEEEEAEVSEQ